jgi:hypothetical protein
MEELNPTWYQQFPACSNDSDRLEDNRKTAEEASLYSMTQILAELETFFKRSEKFLANAMRFKQTLQQQAAIYLKNRSFHAAKTSALKIHTNFHPCSRACCSIASMPNSLGWILSK